MSIETIERSFLVTPPVILAVSNIHGLIKILPSIEPIVSIFAIKHLDTGDSDRTSIEITQVENGAITVATRRKDATWDPSSQPCQVDYTIYLPNPCQLSLNSVGSQVEIIELQGGLNLHTINGKVTLKDISGMMVLSTVSGKISGKHLAGTLDLQSISGDVVFHQAAFSKVDASTVSANISLETSLAKGPYQFQSLSGDVKLYSPPDTHCNINLTSMSGTLKSGFSTTFFGKQKHAWNKRMMVQDGGPDIQMNSVSGNLWILTRENLKNKKDPLFSGLTRQAFAVINQIAEGQLSVEDGVNILNIQRIH